MAAMIVEPELTGENVVRSLEEGVEQLDGTQDELAVDFSSVRRLDASELRSMEKAATMAAEKSVKVVLRGVNVNVYKVLKLMKLAPRFSFLD